MQTVAFHVQKGGTGKTTCAGNVAWLAARGGTRTILVDGDPQGNASGWFLREPVAHELADVLAGKVDPVAAIVTAGPLAILPTAGLGGGLKLYGETTLTREPFVFDDLNTALAAAGYELAVYDCSPGMSALERSILLACDQVVTPVLPEYFSADGLETFAEALAQVNKSYRRAVRHRHVVVNMVNRSFTLHTLLLDQYRKLDFAVHVVPQDRAVADSQAAHQSVAEYAPHSRAVPALEALTEAVLHAA